MFSSSSPVLKNATASTAGIGFRLASQDYPLLPMPAGTTVSASTVATGCTIGNIGGSPVANIGPTTLGPTEDLSSAVSIPLTGCAAGNVITVLVTSPAGLQSTFNFTL